MNKYFISCRVETAKTGWKSMFSKAGLSEIDCCSLQWTWDTDVEIMVDLSILFEYVKNLDWKYYTFFQFWAEIFILKHDIPHSQKLFEKSSRIPKRQKFLPGLLIWVTSISSFNTRLQCLTTLSNSNNLPVTGL